MSAHLHPSTLDDARVLETYSVLFYLDALASSDLEVTVSSSDTDVVSVAQQRVVVPAGANSTMFNIVVMSEGSATVTASSAEGNASLDVSTTPSLIDQDVPDILAVVLTSS